MKSRSVAFLTALLTAVSPYLSRPAIASPWHEPPGALRPGTGQGSTDSTIYAPGMRFPLEVGPAHLNSQVHSLGGSWSHPLNYRLPWQDNFCEKRSWRTPLCPSGSGHQGQDIRPGDKRGDFYWAVAVEDATVVYISAKGGWKVQLRGRASKTLYNYLHLNMDKLLVKVGQTVNAGDRIGLVSNHFGGTPTSVHLHFEMQQAIRGYNGIVHVPPYSSLVAAYKALGEPK